MVTWQHEKKKMCMCVCVYIYIFNNKCKHVFLKLVLDKLESDALKARIAFFFFFK